MKIILLVLFTFSKLYSDTRVYEGVTKYENEVVYYEKHFEDWRDGKMQGSIVTYTDPKGKEIGSRVSDFSQSLAVPSYILKDFRNKSLQGVSWTDQQIQTFTQNQKQSKAKLQTIFPIKDQLVMAGPGLFAFVADNLEYFQSKNILGFQYVTPGRPEISVFYIQYVTSTEKRIEFEVALAPKPFHIFGPHMKLIFDRQKKQLLFYRGPGSIRNEEQHMMTVETRFY